MSAPAAVAATAWWIITTRNAVPWFPMALSLDRWRRWGGRRDAAQRAAVRCGEGLGFVEPGAAFPVL
jgi:hypothetical protein